MIESTRNAVAYIAETSFSAVSQWPAWATYAAGAWSLTYGVLGLYWALGGAGFPFGKESDPGGAELSILSGVQVETGAPVIAILGALGTVTALAMTRKWRRRVFRIMLLGIAWSLAIVLLLVVPDARGLIAVALVPIVLIGALFGWPPGNAVDVVPWPVANQFVLIGGGFLWAATAVAYQRRIRSACGNCGRSSTETKWTMSSVVQWGRRATTVAVIIPAVYAVTRWAWALGVPLGITDEVFQRGQTSGEFWSGAALGMVAVCGGILTIGLSQQWGEIFPRWIPGLGGRRVPIWVAVVPASLVSVLVTMAGLMFVRRTILGTTFTPTGGNWAAIAPELLWPIWGAALGVATLAYYYRRRGRCRHCGRLRQTKQTRRELPKDDGIN